MASSKVTTVIEHELGIPAKAPVVVSKALTPSRTFASCEKLSDATGYLLDIINADSVTPEMADQMMRETIHEWSEHVNPAFLQYRKSVADDFAALEWRDGKPGGCTLIDSRGKEYIDCLGGYGIFNVGRSHPVVVAAVQKQLAKQSLHSQELLDPLRAYAASVLVKTLPGDLKYAFFTNSGAESVEGALKFAMLSTGRRHFIGVIGAFHGKTVGALSGTSKAVFRKPFGNALLPFTHVPVNDIAALTRAFEASKFTGNEIAGFIVEPVLGEGGIHLCTDEYLRAARRLCDEYGARLIFDEVQSGMGRTGTWWACQHAGVAPDILASAKAMGGGVQAAGAVFGTEAVWAKYFENPFLFTTTFGGSPVAMAATIACVHVIETEGLLSNCTERGNQFLEGLRSLMARYPHIFVDVRGRGLMIGLQFPDDDIGYTFARGAFGKGVLLAGTLVNSRVIRVEPPMTITAEEVAVVLGRFEEVLEEMTAAMVAAGLTAIKVAGPSGISSGAGMGSVHASGGAGAVGSGSIVIGGTGAGAVHHEVLKVAPPPAAQAPASSTGGAAAAVSISTTQAAVATPAGGCGTTPVSVVLHGRPLSSTSDATGTGIIGALATPSSLTDEEETGRGHERSRFQSEASEIPMDAIPNIASATATGTGKARTLIGLQEDSGDATGSPLPVSLAGPTIRERSGSADTSDTEVSSVSTSSSEEDERRFDPRPTIEKATLPASS